MKNPEPQLIVGPYVLYLAETGTAFPALDATPPFSGWTEITDPEVDLPLDGITLQRNAEYGMFAPQGSRQPTKGWEKASAWVFSGQVANWSSDIVARLIEDGITGKLGARGPVLKTFAALIRGVGGSPEAVNTEGDRTYQFEVPEAVLRSGVSSKFGLGDEPAMIPWELACFYDETLEAAIRSVLDVAPPTGLTAAQSGANVALAWTAPDFTGGYPVTGYKIERKVGAADWATVVADTGNANTTYTHATQTLGTNTIYRVSAITAASTSTPATMPGRVTGLTATAGSGNVSLAWTAPTADGGSPITGYKVERKVGSAAWSTVVADTGSAATSYVHTGGSLTNTVYRVSAITLRGTGVPSADAP